MTTMLKPKSVGPLAGLVIVDLTRVLAGPYCTMLLADLGARVIKVELPDSGDDARSIGPFIDNGDGTQTSAYFFSVNRNKESIALDLKSPADRAILDRLIASADVLVENFTPGTMDRLGYGWDVLHERHPALVMASVSGFGQTGPYRELPAYDMVVQAMGGVLSLTGEEGGPPTRVGVSIGDLAAGMFATMGVQAAVIGKPDELRGQIVKAFVVLAPGHAPSPELAQEIQQSVRRRLSAHEYPREVEFIDTLPMTTTGKVQRRVLRLRELERSQVASG
jgi:CoA:oxalate CoA-transferase